MQFEDLGLSAPLLRAVATEGYSVPTPIQQKAIPHVLAGRDLLGCAQTGTGKTAAFALPMLQRLSGSASAPTSASASGSTPAQHRPGRVIRALVLTPTRELAAQIADSFRAYGRHTGLRETVIFGGVGQDAQVRSLRNGVDILVATPGRLLDLLNQRHVDLRHLEIFVLDEADRMLDMGFIHDVRRVISALPKRRQTLFFSATMPPVIRDLAASILVNPESVAVTPVSSTAEKVAQRVYFVDRADKRRLLARVLEDRSITRALVFTRTKHGANKLARQLEQDGERVDVIHGNKSQNARTRALAAFKDGQVRLLVATDIAARGIDVEDVSHVINFDLPNVPEDYVHRIGRTARAGAAGIAISLCDHEEREYLTNIERLIRTRVEVVREGAAPRAPSTSTVPATANAAAPRAVPPVRSHAQGAVPSKPAASAPAAAHAPRQPEVRRDADVRRDAEVRRETDARRAPAFTTADSRRGPVPQQPRPAPQRDAPREARPHFAVPRRPAPRP